MKMIQVGKPTKEGRDSSRPKSVKPSNFTAMDLKNPKCFQAAYTFPTNMESPLERYPSIYNTDKENPFADTFPDPLCKLNLKETSDFVKAFPTTKNNMAESTALLETSAQKRRLEAPSTPGRPVFSFSVGNLSRKSFPSKWDNAEKWVIGSSCNESPAHITKPSDTSKISKQNEGFQQKGAVFSEKFRITEEKVSSSVPNFHGSVVSLDPNIALLQGVSSEVLEDKFTDNVDPILPKFKYSEPMKEGFLFQSSICGSMKDAATEVISEIHHRDIRTDMIPLGSSITSRCHTPIKVSSPARHNTPADRSGPLTTPSNTSINISELQECHFAKLDLGTQFDSVVSNWSSREEEEEEISKSLRHFDMGGCRKSVEESKASLWADEERNKYCIRKSVQESKASLWADEERNKYCIRYQREEAKIQAWVNLQNAKAEAQSRKLEVKIQKMKSNLEEKLMKKMAIAHRRAEEWRAAAQQQHSQHIMRASEQAQKMKNNYFFSDHTSCGCFPCNNHL